MSKTAAMSLLFALAATLSAQSITVRGELADGRATGCYYCPGYQYVIKFVGTRLESTTVNLGQFLSQQLEMTGTWDGTIFHVTAARVVASSFDLTGNGTIGNRFRCNAQANPGDLAINAVSLATQFSIPLPGMAALLHPGMLAVQGVGVVNGNGEFKSDLDIPNDPSLVGLRINGEAFFASGVGGPIWSSNLDSKEVSA